MAWRLIWLSRAFSAICRGARGQPPPSRGNLERGQHHDRFPPGPQPVTTCAESPHPLALRHQGGHQPPTGVEQVIAVIEHQQQPPPAQVSHQCLVDRLVGLLLHPHRARHRVRQQIRPLQPAQLNQSHAIREVPSEAASRRQRQPALANPTRAGQRGHTRNREQPLDLRQLATTPDEAAELTRPVAPGPLLQRGCDGTTDRR
jgi:hypothetical protein